MRSDLGRLRVFYLEDVVDLAEHGPIEEPFCAVCSILLPTIEDGMPGWRIADHIHAYHQAPYADVAVKDQLFGEDYLLDIGLAGVLSYQRCLRIYEHARKLLA